MITSYSTPITNNVMMAYFFDFGPQAASFEEEEAQQMLWYVWSIEQSKSKKSTAAVCQVQSA